MTAAHDTQGAVAAADSGGGQPSSHRASGSASVRGRGLSRRLTALAVVPAAFSALSGVVAAALLVRASPARLLQGPTLFAVLALAALVLVVIVAAAGWSARVGRAVTDSAVEHFQVPGQVQTAPAAALPHPVTADNSVFVHLSHRLQSIVHRQIDLLDRLENDVEEPDLLKGLFGVDHLATRMRRHAENLAVLGGAVPRRQWTKPISVMEILRSAVSETLDYARVQVIARTPGALNGYAVASVIHLLAELVENATAFSPQSAKVVVRTQDVAAGLLVEIDDRGPGMPQQEYDRLNALLAEPAEVSVQELLRGARIGLYVVAQLAYRHGIRVRLQANITGGTQALVVLPKALLASEARRLGGPARENADSADADAALPPGALPAPRHAVEPTTDAPPFRSRPATADPVMPASGTDLAGPRPSARGSAPVSGASNSPAPGSAEPAGSDGRPPLPHRRPQQHLAAPLTTQVASTPAGRVSEGATPGLMADFKRGMARGAAESAPGEHTHGNVPMQEGDR